ncbi:MAG: 50S ribosomal protein L9 [Lentisphaeria bacterium]
MSRELILLEDVADLGKIGDTVRVADGFARNYLLPHKLAQVINAGILRKVEARKLLLQKERLERVSVAKLMANKINAAVVTITVAVGENDKMYGSVSSQMIVDDLKKQGIEVDKTAVVLADVIRTLGEHIVPVKLHPEVTAKIKVNVVKE